MAHIFVMARGIQHDIDRTFTELGAQYLPYEYNGQKSVLQVSVRPVRFYELVVPEPMIPVLQNTLWGAQKYQKNVWDELDFKFKAPLWTLRTALGAQKLPDLDKTKGGVFIYNQNVAIYPIGYKPDIMDEVTIPAQQVTIPERKVINERI